MSWSIGFGIEIVHERVYGGRLFVGEVTVREIYLVLAMMMNNYIREEDDWAKSRL